MGKFRERVSEVLPWADPLLDYFDLRKTIIAFAGAIAIGAWSFLKDLSWPNIAVLALTTLVQAAYLLLLPALIRLVHVGKKERPNYSIWKHRQQYHLSEAACLLANVVPVFPASAMDADSLAWYGLLQEAIRLHEIQHVKSGYDRSGKDGLTPDESTRIAVDQLKKFCEHRGRRPEFLS